MATIENRFLGILRSLLIDNSVTRQIKENCDSPLHYASRTVKSAIPRANNIEHSCRVLRNCIDIIRESGLTVDRDSYLLLFYASLLHDTAKSYNTEVMNDIERVLAEKCRLFSRRSSDHGIRSAHYIDQKHHSIDQEFDIKKIKLYGLKDSNIRQLFSIIAFHSSGMMHPCFLPPRKLKSKELLVCLIFWVADVADGACDRALAAQSVDERTQEPKTIARLGVERISTKENTIVWRADKQSSELGQAVFMSNYELSKHRLLLQAFGLPDRIICLQKRQKTPRGEVYIDYNDIISANLCLDVSKRRVPLVISGKTLPEVYEKIVGAFSQISVTETPSARHYFGPVVLEVKDIGHDEADKINIRSETGKNIQLIKKYRDIWLDPTKGAEKEFYFGYTHGQRVWRYLHPALEKDLKVGLEFQEWTGEIDQFKNVLRILKTQGPNARESYVVIPHPMIDNHESDFYRKEEMAPALLAVQFMIEEDNRLSGFALLRAQELSTFFVVNYCEVKRLIEKLVDELKDEIRGIKPGRIAMMTAFGYFAPNTVLLDKPRICKKKEKELETYAVNLDNVSKRREFIELLKEFGKNDYIKIETKWCDDFKKYLPDGPKYGKIKQSVSQCKYSLDLLEKKRSEERYSVTQPEIKQEKEEVIEKLVRVIEEVL